MKKCEEIVKYRPILGKGGGRVVYDLNDGSVLKVPHALLKTKPTTRQNRVEVTIWEIEGGEYLGEILEWFYEDGYIVIRMKKYEVCKKGCIVPPEIEEYADYLTEEYSIWRRETTAYANLGVLKGEMFIIDYGHLYPKVKMEELEKWPYYGYLEGSE